MTMALRTRKVALAAHVTSSVGWLGAVVTSLVLAVVGLVSADMQVVRGVYLALQLIGWYVLVPFSVASLLTGLLQSLSSPWGLLRHYWVLLKLLMNLLATTLLLLYTQTLAALAGQARHVDGPGQLLPAEKLSPIVHATGALLLLIMATVLSVYKPRGLTRYGRRRQLAASRQLSR